MLALGFQTKIGLASGSGSGGPVGLGLDWPGGRSRRGRPVRGCRGSTAGVSQTAGWCAARVHARPRPRAPGVVGHAGVRPRRGQGPAAKRPWAWTGCAARRPAAPGRRPTGARCRARAPAPTAGCPITLAGGRGAALGPAHRGQRQPPGGGAVAGAPVGVRGTAEGAAADPRPRAAGPGAGAGARGLAGRASRRSTRASGPRGCSRRVRRPTARPARARPRRRGLGPRAPPPHQRVDGDRQQQHDEQGQGDQRVPHQLRRQALVDERHRRRRGQRPGDGPGSGPGRARLRDRRRGGQRPRGVRGPVPGAVRQAPGRPEPRAAGQGLA